jgi:hypothetical protein
MEWRSRSNYHSGRFYYSDDPVPGAVSNVRLTIAWVLQVLRQRFARRQRPISLETILFKSGDSHGFTVLGGRSGQASATICPFPQRDGDGREPRSARGATPLQIDRWADEDGAMASRMRKGSDRCSRH